MKQLAETNIMNSTGRPEAAIARTGRRSTKNQAGERV
jgi:hypothetical protein